MGKKRGGGGNPPPNGVLAALNKHRGLAAVAAVLLLATCVGLIVYAFSAMLTRDPGWTTVEPEEDSGPTLAGDFTLVYEIGAGDMSANSEYTAVSRIYTQAAGAAYKLFNSLRQFDGTVNLCTLNSRPNEELTVDDPLYDALEVIVRSGDRSVYLGPVHEFYDGIFQCEGDWQAADFDPATNGTLAEFISKAAQFAADPDSVELELLGGGRVRLRVSEEYLDFARENGATRFLDLGWMTNAFAADAIAGALSSAGYTHGALSSYDGFVRNLDSRGGSYTLSIFSLEGASALVAGVMEYSGPVSAVSFRSYPLSAGDMSRLYRYEDGQVRTAYLDISDGLDRTGCDGLTCYSESLSCGELLMLCAPAYIRETLDVGLLIRLAGNGVFSVWTEGRTICHTDPDIRLTDIYSSGDIRYEVKYITQASD